MWPRTLFGRNLLLMAGLLATCLLLAGLVYRSLVQGPNVREYAAFTALQVQVASQGLALLPPAQRTERLAAFGDTGLLSLATTEPPPAEFDASRRPLMREFIETLRARLAGPGERPAGDDVRWRPRRSELWIALPGLQPPVWAVLSVQGLSLGVSRAAVLAFGACVLLALTGAYLIGRRINRPLQALAEAVQAVAEGRSPAPALAAGFDRAPSEIREVAAQFNGMAAALARADDERALMLAGISHDLRTPLAKLRLGTEMLARDDEAELVERMRRSCEEIDAILGQFIDFARLSNDGIAESRVADPRVAGAPLDLAALVRETAASFDEAMPPLQLALPAAGETLAAGRPHALRRALVNLIGNALRHGGGQAPTTVALARVGRELHLSVLDRGPGIAPGEVARLKRPFTQQDAARGQGGTGLGLAIAEGVARAHGGRLDLLPRAGGGLEARLVLPGVADHPPSPLPSSGSPGERHRQ